MAFIAGAVLAGGSLRTIGGRLLQVFVTLVVVSVLTFALIPLSPGSPALSILVTEGREVTDQAVAAKEHELGLDRPLAVQYGSWLSKVLRADFGRSWKTQSPVSTIVRERVGATLLLGSVALILGLIASVTAAVLSARYHDRLVDHSLRLLVLVLTGIPTFVLGLLTLQYVVLDLGIGKVVSDGTLSSVWLPAIVLAAVGVAGWSRPLRALLLDAQAAPYARTMQARGATEWRILLVHALPNAFVPFLGMVGLGIGGLMGGAPIVESVFSWPGLGAQVVQSVRQRDIPVIQAFVLLSTFGYVLGSLTADMLALLLDPRRRGRASMATG